MKMYQAPRYHDLMIAPAMLADTGPGDFPVYYIEAGDPELPILILYSGFSSFRTQYRGRSPLLSDRYHIYAPDSPGPRLTTVPSNFDFTFSHCHRCLSCCP